MTLRRRINALEKRLGARETDPETLRRYVVDFLTMADLTVGGLDPNDPEDTVERRWRRNLEGMKLADDGTADERIAAIRDWYREGVESVGWVDR